MSSFDLNPYIQGIFNSTQNDASITREREFIDGFFENWAGEFLHPYGDNLLDEGKLNNSLYYCYLSGLSSNFHWYAHSLNCGAYTIVYREFRCILEGLFIVFGIEKKHHGKTLEEKLQILSTSEGPQGIFGKKAFTSSGFSNWIPYYEVYQNLSSYIHFSYSKVAPSIQRIASEGFPEVLDYSFDKTRFLDACSAWQKLAFLTIQMAKELANLDNIQLSISTQIFE